MTFKHIKVSEFKDIKFSELQFLNVFFASASVQVGSINITVETDGCPVVELYCDDRTIRLHNPDQLLQIEYMTIEETRKALVKDMTVIFYNNQYSLIGGVWHNSGGQEVSTFWRDRLNSYWL